jgi:hypothetical protein
MDDAIIARLIGLAAIVVGASVIFFAVRLPLDPKSNLPLIRKAFGGVIAVALILYGLYSLVVG